MRRFLEALQFCNFLTALNGRKSLSDLNGAAYARLTSSISVIKLSIRCIDCCTDETANVLDEWPKF